MSIGNKKVKAGVCVCVCFSVQDGFSIADFLMLNYPNPPGL